ncbi:formylglycine-generating enzyme family protein [Synechocystis sp. LEGE 06083]|uniref:formylglycine-generating enzyme family protein n=1 Tax=Synechocystis sp. LEGE 06083 TaxID=915336 RepID=UPI001882FA87|nr:formylglycine-generating enzyme family protein [Synechocystis sp. LEGE 06083]MBE9194414.1 formylglycine-generating enzyme family protein [Synechocystis sp. LEGE 06083]
MTNQHPRPDDAVLGGQNQAPIDAAVLGGIEGIRQKLASDNENAKKEGVLQALNYGEKGIEALFGVLDQEKSVQIQWLAYQQLEKTVEENEKLDNRSWWGKLWGQEAEKEDSDGLGDQIRASIKSKLKTYFPWYEYKSVTVNRRGEIIQRTPGWARYYREDLGNGVYLDMVYIAGGSFLMGAPSSEKKSDWSKGKEEPQHLVTVPDFWMGKYQVTQAQWQAVMGSNPPRFKGANRPVECVSWDMCQEFCRKLSEQTGKQYRLPSEAEWEYACRAGTKTPFGYGETITTKLANYNGSYTYAEEGKGQYRKQTVEVGSFPPNPWGLYDMHGNVWEWCEDAWHENYQGAPTDGSAWVDNHSQTIRRVLRGGSWSVNPGNCRAANRNNELARGGDDYNGYCYSGLRLGLVSSRTPP